MLLVYAFLTGKVLSMSGFCGAPSRAAVDSIHISERLPEGQAIYRIYDPAPIAILMEAMRSRASVTVVQDDDGNPTGVLVDGVAL